MIFNYTLEEYLKYQFNLHNIFKNGFQIDVLLNNLDSINIDNYSSLILISENNIQDKQLLKKFESFKQSILNEQLIEFLNRYLYFTLDKKDWKEKDDTKTTFKISLEKSIYKFKPFSWKDFAKRIKSIDNIEPFEYDTMNYDDIKLNNEIASLYVNWFNILHTFDTKTLLKHYDIWIIEDMDFGLSRQVIITLKNTNKIVLG